jgi:ubiquinone/menaquinone biosynthesis C-methylase UbiE
LIPDAFERRWRATFERRGALLDDDAGIAGWTTSGLATRFRAFRRTWQRPPRRGTWLDIGCGAGTYTRFLAEEGLEVVGVDYSLPSLLKARERSDSRPLWVGGDVTRIPMRDGAVTGILCFGVLQALSDARPALASMARVLEPQGLLWVDALNARCLPSRIDIHRRMKSGRPLHLRYDDARSLREALRESGFDVLDVQWLPIFPARLAMLQPLVEQRIVQTLLPRLGSLAEAASHSILVVARRRG